MFSQYYKLNIRTCDGCACRCALGYEEQDNGLFYPTVNMHRLTTWIDADGKERSVSSVTAGAALAQARDIVKCCDYYKTGVMPVSGAVKCMMCDLPDSEKCYLRWSPCVDDGSACYATVGGEHCRFGSVAVDGMMLHSKGVEAKTAESALKQLRMYVSRHCEKVNSR